MEEQKTKKKNKKFLVFGVIGLFTLALVSAALVGYLSNKVTADIGIESPFLLALSDKSGAFGNKAHGAWKIDTLDLGSVYGGDKLFVYTKLENRANTEIEGSMKIFLKESTNANLNWDCNMVDSITATKYLINGIEIAPMFELACSEKTDYVSGLTFVFPGSNVGTFAAGHLEYYELEVKLNSAAMPGDYTLETQLIVPQVV